MTNCVSLYQTGVCYQIHKEKAYSLKEAFIGGLTRKINSVFQGKEDFERVRDFWAIRDVSFTIPKGCSVGLVGPNGSGKSTTLKTISGVIYPSTGALSVYGKVSAMVELGIGFDPELTGRENIYLGASMVGLSRKEALSRIDKIIDFSELSEFIDFPVKSYSSGMFARLGFAVATDVDPDLLIIDEALAVGDAAFQKKCLDRMLEFKKRNKTIIFVSHNPADISMICDEQINFSHGKADVPQNLSFKSL